MQQTVLFQELEPRSRTLPTIGEQKDIRYFGTLARTILNRPESTGMGFWSINPYVGCAFGCAYCYARYTHRYVMERAVAGERVDAERELAALPPWLAFERRIMVKENAPQVLRRALRHGSERHVALVRGETVVVGTATDPYQPAERRFRITRGILEVLAEHEGLSVVIISKSPLVTRDIDLLTRLNRNSRLSIHVSLITLDRELARRIEPRAPTPEARVRGIRRLSEAGIDVAVNCMPVLPGITDEPAALEALVRTVAEAGATRVRACALRLQGAARERYVPWIAQEFPALAGRYRTAYANGPHAHARYREGLDRVFRKLGERYGVGGHTVEPEEASVDPMLRRQMELPL